MQHAFLLEDKQNGIQFPVDVKAIYLLQGSETSYIYGITFFVFFPVFCICAAYGFIKVNNSRRKRAKANEPDATCFNSGNGPGLTGVGIKVLCTPYI